MIEAIYKSYVSKPHRVQLYSIIFYGLTILLVSCASPTPSPRPTDVCAPFEEFSSWADCLQKENGKAFIVSQVAVSCGGSEHCLSTHAEAINEIIAGLGEECVAPENLRGADGVKQRMANIMEWRVEAITARIDLRGYELDQYLEYNFQQWNLSNQIYIDELRSVKSSTCN